MAVDGFGPFPRAAAGATVDRAFYLHYTENLCDEIQHRFSSALTSV
jgi:hypothetical protein